MGGTCNVVSIAVGVNCFTLMLSVICNHSNQVLITPHYSIIEMYDVCLYEASLKYTDM